jgi:hypothetical protein
LRLVWLGVKQRFPFTIDAICLLPNYIHSDSVKHELVKQANLWPWSSFHRYVREGFINQIGAQAILMGHQTCLGNNG